MDVLLVSMPFGSVFSPSLGLSLLKATLVDRGISAHTRYFSIPFAERVGQAFYQGIAEDGKPCTRELAGEWIFSAALFGSSPEDEQRYVEDILLHGGAWTMQSLVPPVSPALVRRILAARRQVDSFLAWCLEEVLRDPPKVVGFTSIFQQHVASLALARQIKIARPEVFIVFGGANCEGIMGAETARQFPFVDGVVSGEAEGVFPELVEHVLKGTSYRGLHGIRTRETITAEFAEGNFTTAPPVQKMDDLPVPDFGDYFSQFEASKYGRTWQPTLFFETSRGCWWGERQHCTFCGLNGATMSYRSKSPRRAVDELVALSERYPGCDISVVDNILDMKYFKTVLPELAARETKLDLFYETKSNLKKDQVRMLRAAGVREIQPGIESLSDAVLTLMRKGVSALQNIQLLKWCKELGVKPAWNLLFGFPGEPAEEYARMAEMTPLLSHLPPPEDCSMIRLDRFSPNFFDAEKLGLIDIEPVASYRHVYRLPEDAVANLAYYFTFRYREPRDVAGYVGSLRREVVSWQRAAGVSDLFGVDVGERLLIWDLRPISVRPLTVLEGLDRVLYQACDTACEVPRLEAAAAAAGLASNPSEIRTRLDALVTLGLMLRSESRYMALAIPLGEYVPEGAVVDHFYRVAARLGRRSEDRLSIPLNGSIAPLASTGGNGNRRKRGVSRGRRPPLTPAQFSINDSGDLEIRLTQPRRTNGEEDRQEKGREEGDQEGGAEREEEPRAQAPRGR